MSIRTHADIDLLLSHTAQTLVNMRSTLQGPAAAKELQDWSQSNLNNLCSWQHIVCNDDGRVQTMYVRWYKQSWACWI